MEKKPHIKYNQKANDKLDADLKKYLRANAPQVKFILVDHLFTGTITLTERQPLKKGGYKQVVKEFKDFDEVKSHYGTAKQKASVGNEKSDSKPRSKFKKRGRNAKKAVAGKQPKRSYFGRNNV